MVMDNLRRILKSKVCLSLFLALSLSTVLLKQFRILYTLTNHNQSEIDNRIESKPNETITEYINADPLPAKLNITLTNHNQSEIDNRIESKPNETITEYINADPLPAKLNIVFGGNDYSRPFSNIVKEGKIVGDVSKMLDFVILGFPKCGTSTMKMFLNTSEIWVGDGEQCQMAFPQKDTHQLVKYLYENSPRGDIKRGIKCPLALEVIPHLENMNKYFNNTNIIVGIRHPVRWFESFYNFRVQNMRFKKPMPPVQDCIKMNDKCYSLFPGRGKFHFYLSRLGKTSLEDDRQTFARGPPKRFSHNGKVFIYLLDQLGDKNETRNSAFREDLARFLGIKGLPPDIGHKYTGKKREANAQAKLDKMKIDICDDQYKNVRDILMGYARGARKWITSYFINSEDVFVSSRYYFEQLLEDWNYDPCDSVEIEKSDLLSPLTKNKYMLHNEVK